MKWNKIKIIIFLPKEEKQKISSPLAALTTIQSEVGFGPSFNFRINQNPKPIQVQMLSAPPISPERRSSVYRIATLPRLKGPTYKRSC